MHLRHYRILLLAPMLALPCAMVAGAQSANSSSNGSMNASPNAGDVAKTPLRDVNLEKTKIPPVLQRAVAAPYSLTGLNSCGRIAAQVKQLSSVLGEDIDEAHARGHAFEVGHLMQSVVDSVIPFSGIIKEVSGASAAQRRLQAAAAAGFARRGFLKGIGLSRHCPAPARPA